MHILRSYQAYKLATRHVDTVYDDDCDDEILPHQYCEEGGEYKEEKKEQEEGGEEEEAVSSASSETATNMKR